MPVLFNLFASHNALYDNIEYYNCLLSYLLQLNNTEQLGKKFWPFGPGARDDITVLKNFRRIV